MGTDVSRRQLLTRAAAGGALVWMSPVVLSVPAMAAGSVVPDPGDLVVNGSFEAGSLGDTAPGWVIPPPEDTP